jgi:hypothetical protein
MGAALARTMMLAGLVAATSACTVIAVTGAVVGTGVSVASTAVGAGVAVGKGAGSVATAPFGSEKDK